MKKHIAQGYQQKKFGNKRPSPETLLKFAPYVPAGGMFTTMLDLSKFASMALSSGQPILDKKWFELMLSVHNHKMPDYPSSGHHGLGWHLNAGPLVHGIMLFFFFFFWFQRRGGSDTATSSWSGDRRV